MGMGVTPALLAVSSGTSNREQSGYYMAPAMVDVSVQHLFVTLDEKDQYISRTRYYHHFSS